MGGKSFARYAPVLAAGMFAVLSGCTIESPLSVRRFWADYNTLRTPAMYYDKVTRVPLDSARVRELRWMYNKGPHDLGPYSLIPETSPASQHAPKLQGSNVVPPLPRDGPMLPPTPSGRSGDPPLPPLPRKLQSPGSSSPVAEGTPRRVVRNPGAWRFVR